MALVGSVARCMTSVSALRTRFTTLAVACACLAVLHGLVTIAVVSNHTSFDSASFIAAAHALRHGTYPAPYGPGDTIEDRTPGYPLFLAVLGGGGPGASRTIVLLVQAAAAGLATWLLAVLVRRLWGPVVGLTAAALYAIDPLSKRAVTLILSEQLATVLFLVSAYGFVRGCQERRARWWATSGLAAGALTLVRPSFAVTLALPVVGALVLSGESWRSRLRNAALAAACAAALVAPWLARNAIVLGQPVLASSGDGVSLLLAADGEGPTHSAWQLLKTQMYARQLRGFRNPSAEALRRNRYAGARAELAYDQLLERRALHLYRTRLAREPLTVLGEYGYRAYFLWEATADLLQPQPSGPARVLLRVLDAMSILIACLGLVLAARIRGPSRALVVFTLAFTALTAIGHVEPRYSDPLRGLFFGFVALGLCSTVAFLRRARTAQST